MKFRKKPLAVDAVQWFKDGDHPSVVSRPPTILFDVAENYFYVSHFDAKIDMPGYWLAIDSVGEIARGYGTHLSFAFYSIRSGKEFPASERPELLKRYMQTAGWASEPTTTGYISDDKSRMKINQGDWIVTDSDGKIQVFAPEEFAKVFERAE